MDANQLIQKISDRTSSNRDLLIDELCDLLEANYIDSSTSQKVVLDLIEIARDEPDEAVHESILNLLGFFYEPSGSCSLEIETFISESIETFWVGSLIQALSIIAESQIETRQKILTFYAQSDLKAVRETACNYLSDPS